VSENDLTYTNAGDYLTVWRGGKQLGRVRKLGMYWHAYDLHGALIRGTFLSMSAAGRRAAERAAAD
jgi:hypothetical protein